MLVAGFMVYSTGMKSLDTSISRLDSFLQLVLKGSFLLISWKVAGVQHGMAKKQIRCTIAERLMSRVPIGFSISNIWKSKTVILYVRYVRTIMHWKFQHTKHYVSMSLCGFVSGSWGTKLVNKYTFNLCVANLGPRFILKFHAIHEVNECD